MAALPINLSDVLPAEKLELVDVLWQDVETHLPALIAEQREELDRRVAA
jgi:putative addiction module component (TIGR02574 family)